MAGSVGKCRISSLLRAPAKGCLFPEAGAQFLTAVMLQHYRRVDNVGMKMEYNFTRGKTVDEIFCFIYVSIAKNRIYRKISNVCNKSSIESILGIGYNEFSAADGKQPPV